MTGPGEPITEMEVSLVVVKLVHKSTNDNVLIRDSNMERIVIRKESMYEKIQKQMSIAGGFIFSLENKNCFGQ